MKFLSLFAVGVALVGCGGTSFIGSGEDAGVGGSSGTSGTGASSGQGGGVVGGGGGSGGAAAGGSGGTATGGSGGGDPCSGRPCGASCNACPAGQTCPPVEMFCDAAGSCQRNFPVCEVPECITANDCPAVGAPCQMCADGSSACPSVECINGQCAGSFPECPPPGCSTDTDCPVSAAPCQLCPDGSAACPFAHCIEGQCVNGVESCGGYEPCAGKTCGEVCTPCDPADPGCMNAPTVVMYCDAAGACGLTTPVCRPCEQGLCTRPYECVSACGSEPEYVGCCQCEPPLFDAFITCMGQ
jgi:large repetitive protein